MIRSRAGSGGFSATQRRWSKSDALFVGNGWTITPDNGEMPREAMAKAFRRWQNDALAESRADMGVLRCFDGRELAGELAHIFDGLIALPPV